MRQKIVIAFSLLTLIFLSGGLGLRPLTECTNGIDVDTGQPMSDGDKMLCYHEAAITQAVACPGCAPNPGQICQLIITVSDDAALRNKNIRSLAENQRNNCLYDVARYTRDASYCQFIDETRVQGTLWGADVSKGYCEKGVQRLLHADPQQYLSRPDNFCSLAFIFPFLVVVTLLKRK